MINDDDDYDSFSHLPTSCILIILEYIRPFNDHLSLSVVSKLFLEVIELNAQTLVQKIQQQQQQQQQQLNDTTIPENEQLLWEQRLLASFGKKQLLLLYNNNTNHRNQQVDVDVDASSEVDVLVLPWRCKAHAALRIPLYSFNHDDEITQYNYNAYVRVIELLGPKATTTSSSSSTTTTVVAARQSGQIDIWELQLVQSSTNKKEQEQKLVSSLTRAGSYPLTDIWVQEIHPLGKNQFVIVQEPRHSRDAIISVWQHHFPYPHHQDGNDRIDTSQTTTSPRTTLITSFERHGALSISCVHESMLYLVKHDNDHNGNGNGILIDSIHLDTMQDGPTRSITNNNNSNTNVVVRIHTVGNRWLLLALQQEGDSTNHHEDGDGDSHSGGGGGVWNGLQLLNPQTLEMVWSMEKSFSTVRAMGRTVTTTSFARVEHESYTYLMVDIYRINNDDDDCDYYGAERQEQTDRYEPPRGLLPELIQLNKQQIRRPINGGVYPLSTNTTTTRMKEDFFLWRPAGGGGGLEVWDDQGCCIYRPFVPQVIQGTTESSVLQQLLLESSSLRNADNSDNTIREEEEEKEKRLEHYAGRKYVQNTPSWFVTTDTMLLATYFRDRDYANPGILVYPMVL